MVDYRSLSAAWTVISEAFHIPQVKEKHSEQVLKEAIGVLHNHGISHIIKDWFLETYQNNLRDVIIPEFWNHFNGKDIWMLPEAINKLYQSVKLFMMLMMQLEYLVSEISNKSTNSITIQNVLNPVIQKKMYLMLRSLLLVKIPVHFHSILSDFYTRMFKVFHSKQKLNSLEEEESDDPLQCCGCECEPDNCCCQRLLDAFQQITTQLNELEILESVVGDAAINVAQQHIEQFVQDTCRGNFEVSYLSVLEEWLEDTVLTWLQIVYQKSTSSDEETPKKNIMSILKEQLIHAVFEKYTEVRLEQLFNIVIEFPESQAALEDLRECLERTNLRPKLICSLKKSLETRLLHPGVNTTDILTAYISAIKALRVLDPTGVVLQLVCEPVCKYLRSRDDTVRCIVTNLTDESCSELASELMKGAPLMLEDSYHSDDEKEDWENWQPDPVDADPAKASKSHRSSDIISMLVNIYGSKELFVNEYRTLLADRLLSSFSYNTEREIRYLELLKLRFGESQLYYCEVMLKDVADSRRINGHVNSTEASSNDGVEFPINAMILSAQFWPTIREEKLELPAKVSKALQRYTTAFEMLKGNRTLTWKPHLGLVHLEIELKDRVLKLSVSPVHATIIWHYQEKLRWTVDELSSVMHVPVSALRRKITFWQSHGVLREEENDTFVLVEEQQGRCQEVVVMEEDETESVTASSQDQKEEELQMFWSFIVGMLTNLESLPLERIHTMLRMFAMPGPNTSECGIHELRQFLDRKVREQKLLYSGGLYRLPRSNS
ncbi:anaphase-promoting complex subunit 2 isoform X1 [Centruroides vittatus]|uniref:anaphase-promoting complex subunit 2 isoform X1 n=1 Tax=Centruroides vittatus TaxID=120091 RepID=UPI00350EA692